MRPQVCRLEDGPHLTMGAPWLQTSNLQNWELYIPGVYKPPRLWCFLMAVQSTKKTSNACPLWASTERSSIHPRVLCSGERKAALHTHGYSLRAIICFQIVSIVSEGKYGKQRDKKLTLSLGDKRISVSVVITVQRNEMSYLCLKLMDNLAVLKKER